MDLLQNTTIMLRLFFLVLLLLPALISCSFSSSSATTDSSDLTSSSGICVFDDCSSVSSFETTEYNAQKGLDIINAADAYFYLYNNDKDYLGDNVVVAVIDTGVLGTHSDIEDNYDSSSSIGDSNASNGYDDDGHGTHVAGIIGATLDSSGMHGVAPNASIVGVAYTGISGVGSGSYSFEDYVVDSNATVVNMSFGSTVAGSNYSKLTDILDRSSVADDIVFVAASGNSRISYSGGVYSWNSDAEDPFYPARYADDDTYNALEGQMLSVVAVNTSDYDLIFDFDGSGESTSITATSCSGTACLAYYSNFCGVTEKYCLAAPGGDNVTYGFDSEDYGIYSTYANSDSSYTTMSGTSMAAPHVSGAAAVLKAAWPSLTGSEIVDILISTAEYLSCSDVELAVDASCTESSDSTGSYNNIYGRGLLDLYAAVQNSGVSSLYVDSDFSSNSYNLDDTSLTFNSLFGNGLVNSELLSQAVFFDEYNRDYRVDLRTKISSQTVSSGFAVSDYLEQKQYVKPVSLSLGGSSSLSFTYNTEQEEYLEYGRERRYLTEAAQEESSDITLSNFSIGENFFRSSFSLSYVAGDEGGYDSSQKNFLALTDNENIFYDLNEDELVELSLSYSLSDNIDLITHYRQPMQQQENNPGYIVSTGFSYNKKSFVLDFAYNIADYQDSIWGMSGTEAFALSSGGNRGDVYEISLTKYLADDLSFVANYQHSFAQDSNYSGMISKLENLTANSLSLSLNKINVRSRYGIGYALPPAIISGNAELNVATGRDGEVITIASEKLNLAVTEREQIFELYYQRSGSKLDFTSNLFLRDNFRNIAGARDEVILFNFARKF